MSQFVNMDEVAVALPLKKAHYPFPRVEKLRATLKSRLTDYFTYTSIGAPFEAKGVLVTGNSRVGKSHELRRVISELNEDALIMPSGLPARIVSCKLPGRMTWKDLGIIALQALEYPCEGRNRTQAYIWSTVHQQAKRQGVVGIYFDECQHMFTDTGNAANRIVLDQFKSIMKDERWPLMVIMSGVPTLAKHIESDIEKEERKQLKLLLSPVHFEMINPEKDFDELNTLCYSYADKAGVSFDKISSADFYERLSFACSFRWGLVIELLIEALTKCVLAGQKRISMKHFDRAFSVIYGTAEGFSPFSLDDYEEAFNPDKLLEFISSDT
ncbi:ATP-binding protein [Cereibacter sp. SYSU M97828]|nr:ATP-binding protein [Cereibacter flavus]